MEAPVEVCDRTSRNAIERASWVQREASTSINWPSLSSVRVIVGVSAWSSVTLLKVSLLVT